jgi:cytochrome o ubiquinol oxidase subunit 2
MTKHKHNPSRSRYGLLILLWLLGLGLLFTMLLYGTDIRLLNPKGVIASDQFKLIVFSAGVLMLIAVPTLFFLYFFAWKYRESNHKAAYDPDKRHGRFFIFSLWAIPCLFALVLASVMWVSTHKLDPRKSIASQNKALHVQVVALRWKWLFIYPEQGIATVNFVQAPVNTPVEFDLTADDAPMSSFWIPHWGGQLYAMTGHDNRLNLMPTDKGDSAGSSAEINGDGFAGMKFTARASSQADFDNWVQQVKQSPDILDLATYTKLLEPSENNKAALYSATEPNLYGTVLSKYMGSHNSAEHAHE